MSDVRIDSISLEVDASAAVSAAGIDKLAAALGNLKDNAKLTSTANNLSKLSASLQSLQNVSAASQKMRSLANALNQLSNVKDLGNFKKSVSSIKNLTKALGELKDIGRVASQMQALASAMTPLSNLGKSSLGSTLNQLKKLPEVTTKLDPYMLAQFTRRIEQLTAALAPLAKQMATVAAGFSALPRNVAKSMSAMDNYRRSSTVLGGSLGGLRTSWLAYGFAIRTVGNMMTDAFTDFTDRYETMNLFSVAMGEYTQEAYDYALKVQSALGVNAAEWAKDQAVFMQLIAGFGEARDQAYEMSKGLTQITYDISSLFNLPIEEAFTKVQSGISGELEPLRRLGFDLSQARLQEIALANGITKKVSAMNQAEKSELRYIAITQQMPNVIGDMSRTLESPANALRVLRSQFSLLSQTIGSVINVIVYKFIPYIQALVSVVIAAANAISVLLTGKSLGDWDMESFNMSSNLGAAAGSADDIADSTGAAADNTKKAADNAKKAKQYMMGWDELNVLDSSSSGSGSGGSGGGGGGGGGGLGLDLDSLWADSMLDSMNSKLEETVNKVKELLSHVAAVGAAFAAWKIANKVIEFIDKIKELGGLKLSFKALGLGLMIADIEEFARYFRDFLDNGATFQNVTGMIAEFAGMLGDAFVMLGKIEIAGPLKVVQGVLELASALGEIAENGFSTEAVMTVVRGISNIMIGFGLLSQNMQLLGGGLLLQGLSTIIKELAENWEAIKQGDWSGVDKIAMIIGAVEAIAGLLMIFNVIKGFGGAVAAATGATAAVETAATVTQEVSTTVSATLSPNLSALAKNLGMGIVIIAEVAAAAVLIVGAIYILGEELGGVVDAWQPVIDNGGTALAAMGIGTAMLAGVGAATAGLGTVGTSLAVNIGLGTLMLIEVSAATDLFLGEILLIGVLLSSIASTWQPVLDNAGTVAIAIGVGTGLLIAIGVVTAALGVAAVASVGLLPLAIGLGTAMLVELSAATDLFLGEIVIIGALLSQIGTTWQPVLDNAATVESGIAVGTELLIAIGVVCAALGVAAVASVGLLPLAIGLGTSMLAELAVAFVEFSKCVIQVADEIKTNLAPALTNVSGVLPGATSNMQSFKTFMEGFAAAAATFTASSAIAGFSGMINKIIGFFTGDPFKSLAKDVENTYKQAKELNSKLELANPELEYCISLLKSYKTFIEEIEKLTNSHNSTSLSGQMMVNMKEVGAKLVTGFADGIKSKHSELQNAGKTAATQFITNGIESKKNEAKSAGGTLMDQVKSGIEGKQTTVENAAKAVANAAAGVFTASDFTNKFNDAGKSIVDAIADGVKNNKGSYGQRGTVLGELHQVKSDIETIMSNLLTNVNHACDKILKAVNDAKTAAASVGTITVGSKTVTKRASGGTVPSGQLFLANEAGPELVGSIGNTTTVMNNDQIVAAVSSGVAKAVASVMSNSASSESRIKVYLDGKEIYANQKKVERSRGREFNTGAFAR